MSINTGHYHRPVFLCLCARIIVTSKAISVVGGSHECHVPTTNAVRHRINTSAVYGIHSHSFVAICQRCSSPRAAQNTYGKSWCYSWWPAASSFLKLWRILIAWLARLARSRSLVRPSHLVTPPVLHYSIRCWNGHKMQCAVRSISRPIHC